MTEQPVRLQAIGTLGAEAPGLCLITCHYCAHQRSPREKGTLTDEKMALALTNSGTGVKFKT